MIVLATLSNSLSPYADISYTLQDRTEHAFAGFQGVGTDVTHSASDFGPFNDLRSVVFFSLWFFIGVQTIFSSFFLSMLGISRGTYIGDYEKDPH